MLLLLPPRLWLPYCVDQIEGLVGYRQAGPRAGTPYLYVGRASPALPTAAGACVSASEPCVRASSAALAEEAAARRPGCRTCPPCTHSSVQAARPTLLPSQRLLFTAAAALWRRFGVLLFFVLVASRIATSLGPGLSVSVSNVFCGWCGSWTSNATFLAWFFVFCHYGG